MLIKASDIKVGMRIMLWGSAYEVVEVKRHWVKNSRMVVYKENRRKHGVYPLKDIPVMNDYQFTLAE